MAGLGSSIGCTSYNEANLINRIDNKSSKAHREQANIKAVEVVINNECQLIRLARCVKRVR